MPAQTGRYGWLGAHQRATELPSGAMTMGARVYLPQIGRFLQPGPVVGRSANPYDYTYQDPVNQIDLDGKRPVCITIIGIGLKTAGRQILKQGGKGAKKVGNKVKRTGRRVIRGGFGAALLGVIAGVRGALRAIGKRAYDYAGTKRGRELFGPSPNKGTMNDGKFRIGIGRRNNRWFFRVAWGGTKSKKWMRGHINTHKGEKRKNRPQW